MGYIKNFFNECRAYHIVKKVYRKNKADFDKIGLKMDWIGRLYIVLNRNPDVPLGDDLDEALLHKELAEIWSVLVKNNIVDILAYELKPLEEVTKIDDTHEEFEHGYLVTFTPAWNLDRQYVTIKSVIFMILFFGGIIGGVIWGIFKYLIPYLHSIIID